MHSTPATGRHFSATHGSTLFQAIGDRRARRRLYSRVGGIQLIDDVVRRVVRSVRSNTEESSNWKVSRPGCPAVVHDG